ncbi:hypothetical protein [Chitinophaga vietnamensis]|uniref:hypothetical protein n=1 Tax=Chitinophaga vietnamensis TaxID=2593957 RepID=UPI001177985A|nr:hypothetical protein [Chitinophaga vietnamensis]
MKKKTYWLVTLNIALSLLFTACNKKDLTPPLHPDTSTQRIKEQLDSVVSVWNPRATVDLKLKGYTLQGTDITSGNIADIKRQLSNGNNIVPYFDGQNVSSFKLNTLHQSIALQRAAEPAALNKLDQDADSRFSRTINSIVLPGQHIATLQWEAQGQTFTSLCIYDDKGLVYDHVLANMFLASDSTKPEGDELTRLSDQQGRAQSLQSYTAQVVDVTIKWIWGSTRGKVRVYHSILVDWSNRSIVSNWGSSDNYMSIGSADSRQSDYGNHRTYALLSWAYGWATPTASFSFSHDGSNKWSVSLSGVGSKGSGQGIHNYYLQ